MNFFWNKIIGILNNNVINDTNTESINESIETNNQLIETIPRNKKRKPNEVEVCNYAYFEKKEKN
jgi:hypothetical protein